MKKLREKVLQIAKLAQECPDNLQQTCFEILLKHALKIEAPSQASGSQSPTEGVKSDSGEKIAPKSSIDSAAKKQDDLSVSDVDVRVRNLLKKYSLELSHLNQLYYKENNQVLPLYDDLKTTKASECQIRITLLQCLHNAIQNGSFQTPVEAARDEARERKCYNETNWSANYSNNATLFDFDKYSRRVSVITLSEEGKAKLADVIKELQ